LLVQAGHASAAGGSVLRRGEAAARTEAKRPLVCTQAAGQDGAFARPDWNLSGAFHDRRMVVQEAPLPTAMFDINMRKIATSRRSVGEFGLGRGGSARPSGDAAARSTGVVEGLLRNGLGDQFIEPARETWSQVGGRKRLLRRTIGPGACAPLCDIGGITLLAESIAWRRSP
jgi:hypothetical protein